MLFVFQDHKDEVTCVTYNWNDCYIASGSQSGEIILHSVTTNISSTPFGHGYSQVQYEADKRFWKVLIEVIEFMCLNFLKLCCFLQKFMKN